MKKIDNDEVILTVSRKLRGVLKGHIENRFGNKKDYNLEILSLKLTCLLYMLIEVFECALSIAIQKDDYMQTNKQCSVRRMRDEVIASLRSIKVDD